MSFNFFAYMARMKLIKRWSLMKSVSDENITDKMPVKEARKAPNQPALVTDLPPAAPRSRATPLKRPVSPVSSRPAAQQVKPMQSIKRDQSEKPAFTYADLLKERRKARRPLSTGNDRF